MQDRPEEIKKLMTVATDMELASKLREKSIEIIGKIGTYEALLALLELAANERLTRQERETALKYSRDIVHSGR